MRILAVSDVTMGYGTPQLPLLTSSLAEHYRGEGWILEPVQPDLSPRHGLFPHLRMESCPSTFHPHTQQGRQEYLWRASQRVNELKPDVLVICCTFCLPVAFRLNYRPRKVVYYSVESIPFYGAFDEEMNRHTGPLVDIVIFPEENRALNEINRYGFREAVKLVLYNATNRRDWPAPLPADERNGRILYAGTISPSQTYAGYYVNREMANLPVDLYGPLKFLAESDREAFLRDLQPGMRYRGYVDARELSAIRRLYITSLVMWNPSNENQYYAAPNKFFDSIADGVPPVAAPHPQCKLLIERYQCGLLTADWELESVQAALRRIVELYKRRAEWERMVENCRRAVCQELNWDTQFAKVIPHL
jgi:glycosyltransferase involved in cell wall biosynthesis